MLTTRLEETRAKWKVTLQLTSLGPKRNSRLRKTSPLFPFSALLIQPAGFTSQNKIFLPAMLLAPFDTGKEKVGGGDGGGRRGKEKEERKL